MEKLKAEATKFAKVEAGGLAESLATAAGSLQVVFVNVPWCEATGAIFPRLEALAAAAAPGTDFFLATLEKQDDKDAAVLGDVWMSPTIKFFQGSQESHQLVNPSLDDLERFLKEHYADRFPDA